MNNLQYTVVLSIIITWICSWLDGSAPYFPIEISRTATGRFSYYPFLLGSLVSFFFIPKDKIISWVGYFLLTLVDDTTSWSVHMLGVFILICGVIINAWGDKHKMVMVVCICGLFAARIVAKLLIVWGVELDMTWDIARVFKTSKEIMYTGVCKRPELTLTVFKIGGIMQWLCFWAMSKLI